MINDGPSEPAPEKFVAAKYSSGKVVILMNLHPNIFLVNGCQKFLTISGMRISDRENYFCLQFVHHLYFSWFAAGLRNKCLVFLCRLSFNNTR